MTILDHFEFPSPGEEEAHCSPPAQTKTKALSSAPTLPQGGEETNYGCPAARRLEESREALAWSSGRPVDVPIPPPLYLRAANAVSRLVSTCANICSTSKTSNASCVPSLDAIPALSEKIASTSSLPRPLLMSRPCRAASESTLLLRQALHSSESLRGLSHYNVRHRYTAWETANAKLHGRKHERPWVGVSSAGSSDDEEDAFEKSMVQSWNDILDAYEDEEMAGWDHWSGRKLQPDELDDEY